ncbi:MAG: phosphoglucomutase/phosphomannomutase family protein [Coriobacteriales bacterium]|jgi:phosphomannomutase|nr:phosphoglucomutase/phosphomannomutase family protein [Coriobacteriales bacterium]
MSESNPAATPAAAPPDDLPTENPRIDPVHFGTDGWRAILGEDFNPRTVARVADAAARVFRRRHPHPDSARPSGDARASKGAPSSAAPAIEASDEAVCPNTLIVGYDCRRDAGRYSALVAAVLASYGFDVAVSDRYCPTPALCWTIAHDPRAVGGLMLTSSHNPAEYLGIKLRMADGGASPAEFTDEVEGALLDEMPAAFDEALAAFAEATNGTPASPALPLDAAPGLRFIDLMSPYLDDLAGLVDAEAIAAAALRVVVDPLFGAGRGYLAGLLGSKRMGVTVLEVNGDDDPSFNGLHPEPILPWVEVGARAVAERGFDACFVTDGDADRIGALDETGTYVTSHRILALLIAHLVEDRGQTGRVVRTQAGSNLLRRQCERLGLELTTRPIGFKWIYGEMLKGDVLIGGEESGGMGVPGHVRERDGLLMALMLTELMAQKGKGLRELTDEMLATLGTLEYARRDLRLTPAQKDALLAAHVHVRTDAPAEDDTGDGTTGSSAGSAALDGYRSLFEPLGETLVSLDRSDGIKFELASDAWLLVRPSGTEPLVRVYAEAADAAQVEALLDLGCALAQG